MDMFDAADFCRACLTTEYSLTETTSLDHDSVKFSDKLTVCVTDVMWLTEGLPSFICSNCIKHLRGAYDFRNVCLESDKKFRRYISQMQDKSKIEMPQDESTSLLEDKIEITSTQVVTDMLPCVKEEAPNSPQIHFLVDDDCESRDCTSETEKHDNFIGQKQLEPVVDIAGRQLNIENSASAEVTGTIQQDQQLQQELRIQQQPPEQKHVIERIAGVHRRPPSPENVTLDGVKSKSYTCNVCNKTFRHRGSLINHKRKHMNEKPIQCKYCRKRFSMPCLLKYHMRKHTGEKPYSCEICGRKFASRSNLYCHIKTHSGPFTCKICEKTFVRSSNLNAHVKIHTGEQITCYVCDAKFTYLHSLKAHMRKHTSKQSYPCTASDEQPHQQDGVHSKSYTCKVCSKSYQNKSSLTNHMLIHKGEISKPFECKYCKKRFRHSSQLKVHNRSHTGEKPFQCAICNKQFVGKGILRRHIRTHMGEKPFACTVCDRRFLRAFSLKVHMRTHTGERPYRCDTCGKKFIQRQHLTKHMKAHE